MCRDPCEEHAFTDFWASWELESNLASLKRDLWQLANEQTWHLLNFPRSARLLNSRPWVAVPLPHCRFFKQCDFSYPERLHSESPLRAFQTLHWKRGWSQWTRFLRVVGDPYGSFLQQQGCSKVPDEQWIQLDWGWHPRQWTLTAPLYSSWHPPCQRGWRCSCVIDPCRLLYRRHNAVMNPLLLP